MASTRLLYEARKEGVWIKASVSNIVVEENKKTYTVVSGNDTWDVEPDEVRQHEVNLHNMESMKKAEHETLLNALALSVDREELEMRRKVANQLNVHLCLIRPTPYRYSQHFAGRYQNEEWQKFKADRVTSRVPSIKNKLAYVGEQDFFGVNMLGTFSACDWGVQKRNEIKKEDQATLDKAFKNHFSFGNCCFILDECKMLEQVIIVILSR
jgi:hypothetical protein